jgi:hypothetical protein
MQNDRTFRSGRKEWSPKAERPNLAVRSFGRNTTQVSREGEVSNGAHIARQSNYFLSAFFFLDFFLLAMVGILVRVNFRRLVRLTPPTVKTALHRVSQHANEKWKKLLYFRNLTDIQLLINRRSGS